MALQINDDKVLVLVLVLVLSNEMLKLRQNELIFDLGQAMPSEGLDVVLVPCCLSTRA